MGLMAALGYYLYARRLKHVERALDALPQEERARFADTRLSRYHLDAGNLTREQKNRLIPEEMRRRHRFACIVALLGALVFVSCFGIAANAYLHRLPRDAASPVQGDTPVAAPVDRAVAKGLWEQSLTRLVPLLRSNQNRDGSFGSTIGDAVKDLDAWTSSQCITALSAVRIEAEDAAALARAVHWLAFDRKDDGWSHYSHLNRRTSTEVTAWVGIACEGFLEQTRSGSADAGRSDALANLQIASSLLSNRQLASGAWSSLPIPFPDPHHPTNSRGPYATAMAMTFLLHLKGLPPQERSFSDEELDRKIERGLQAVLSEFNPDFSGWEASPADGPHDGVTILDLLLLQEARGAGFPQIESDRRFRQARRAWTNKWQGESSSRHISANFDLSQKQDCFDENGLLIETAEFPVRILWFPWTFLLASRFASDESIPSDEHERAVRIESRMWQRLPDALDDASVGGTFRVAEMVDALRRIGRLNGWN